MAEDGEATEETPSGDEIKIGSDELTEGVSKTATGISRLVLGLWRRLDGHPILKFLLLAGVSTVVGNIAVRTIGATHNYFFDAAVPLSRDVAVETFPLPLGLSVWLLSILLLFVGILGYLRVVALRQRIEELERRVEW